MASSASRQAKAELARRMSKKRTAPETLEAARVCGEVGEGDHATERMAEAWPGRE